MYVFSFTFLIGVLLVALVHARAGQRVQRVLLFGTSLAVYASFGISLLLVLLPVVMITWVGIRARHFTDDRAMLRFARIVAAIAALLPLVVLRYADVAVSLSARLANQTSLIDADWSLSPLVPVGAAFFTLQAIDSLFSAHRQPASEQRSFMDHALMVSFFPTIFVGPVQRTEVLLPQLRNRRVVTSQDVDAGVLLFIFGAFQKLVVADNLLPIADAVYARPTTAGGPEIVMATLAFSVGIIADLGGYTLAVLGIARIFGVQLSPNVDQPYLARSPLEFWDRWNLSVTDWFLRYVFLPLRGPSAGRTRTALAMAVTFLLGALWFGERLGLLVWGFLHLLAALVAVGILRRRAERPAGRLGRAAATIATFGFVSYAWIWFRADTLQDAVRLHLRLPNVEITTFTVGSVFTVALFAALLVAADVVLAALLARPEVTATRTVEAFSLPLLRGTVVAFALVGTLVFSTADLHQSVLGLR